MNVVNYKIFCYHAINKLKDYFLYSNNLFIKINLLASSLVVGDNSVNKIWW